MTPEQEADIRAMLKNIENVGGTHWSDCYLRHLDCAVHLVLDALDATRQERDTLKAELAHWKVCANCGETLAGPGVCDKAVGEHAEGLEAMNEDLLGQVETLRQERDEALWAIEDAHATRIKWQLRTKSAEARLAAVERERDSRTALCWKETDLQPGEPSRMVHCDRPEGHTGPCSWAHVALRIAEGQP